MTGYGKLTWASSGNVYMGALKNGKRQGKGILKYTN
jgi:hypothetical protein